MPAVWQRTGQGAECVFGSPLPDANSDWNWYLGFNISTPDSYHLPAPLTYYHERLIMNGQRRRSNPGQSRGYTYPFICSQHSPMTPTFLIPILSACWTGGVCLGATNRPQVTLKTVVISDQSIKFKSDPTHGKFVLFPLSITLPLSVPNQ